MGFGLFALGYLLIIADAVGGGVIGWPLLAYASFKLSGINKSFRGTAVLASLSVIYSVVNLGVLFKFISDSGVLYKTCYAAYLALVLSFHFSYLLNIRQIAKSAGSATLANGAISRLYFTGIYYLWAIVVLFFPQLAAGTLGMLLMITRYIVGVVNILFIYTCFARITTSSQLERDKSYFRKLNEKEKARKQRRAQESGDGESDEKTQKKLKK